MSVNEKHEAVRQLLSEQELNALDFAEQLYGSEAKLATHELLVGSLALDIEVSEQVLQQLSRRMDDLRFTDKREIAEHVRAVSKILGPMAIESTNGVISLVKNEEPGKTDTEPSKSSIEISPENLCTTKKGVQFDAPKNEIANNKAMEKYGAYGVRRVTLLDNGRIVIGNENKPLSYNLTHAQSKQREIILGVLIDSRGTMVRPKVLKEAAGSKAQMSTCMRTLSKHLTDQDGLTIITTRRINDRLSEYGLTDDIVIVDERQETIEPEDVKSEVIPQDVNDQKASAADTALSHEEIKTEVSHKTVEYIPVHKACQQLADELKLTMHDELLALRYIFELGRNAPSREIVKDVQELASSIYAMTKASKFALLELTPLELKAMDMLLGTDSVSAQPFKAVENRLSDELARSSLSLDIVVSLALQKFTMARKLIKERESGTAGN